MPKKKKVLFGEFLRQRRKVTKVQVEEALVKQAGVLSHRKIGEILVRLGYLDKEVMLKAVAEHQGIEIGLKLKPKDLQKVKPEFSSKDFMVAARLYKVVPIAMRSRGHVLLATVNPTRHEEFSGNLERITGYKICFVFVTEKILHSLFEGRYGESFEGEQVPESILRIPSVTIF